MTHPISSSVHPSTHAIPIRAPPCRANHRRTNLHTHHTTHTSSRVCTPCLSLCLFSLCLSVPRIQHEQLAGRLSQGRRQGQGLGQDCLAASLWRPRQGGKRSFLKGTRISITPINWPPSPPSIAPDRPSLFVFVVRDDVLTVCV
jgi:hypothetical protein